MQLNVPRQAASTRLRGPIVTVVIGPRPDLVGGLKRDPAPIY